MKTRLKSLIAALGLAVASASAGAVTLYTPITGFEDDNVDFIIKGPNSTGGLSTLEVGDTLVSMLEFSATYDPLTSASASILPNELSGVAAITLMGFADLDGLGGLNDLIFGPPTAGLNTWLGGNTVTGGAAGGGAMVALFLDGSPDLTTTGSTNCTSLAHCISLATDGSLYAVAGFEGDTDEYWVALNGLTNLGLILSTPNTTKLQAINYALSVLDPVGKNVIKDGLTCSGITAFLCGGDKKIDLIGSADILGGQGLPLALTADGAFGHSDIDFQVSIPEPATLSLLGMGLLGFGAAMRKRKQ